jgi:pimeloyl-ACP methyl ester carboxylesterase
MVTDDTQEVAAHLYFAAFTADRPPGTLPRPITFVFPGGPGAPATLSHDGPRIVVVKDGEAKVTDNPDTFLSFTDLVLVDPVGTGYSRVTKAEYTSKFYGIKQDTDSLVEFVRLYLQRFDPAESPVFLSGGSWGSVRSILVADAAINRGIPIRGIMVSAEGAILSIIGTDPYYATLIPGFTLVAFTHHRLAPDLRGDRNKAIADAQAWASSVYLPALARGNTLPDDERRRIAAQMARLTGLKVEVIESHGLKLSQEEFANELLRDEGKSVGFYDTRITGPAQTGSYDATKDPSLMARGVAYPSLAERYLLNRELGMVSNNYYAGPFGGGWPVKEGLQDWMAVKWGMPMEQEPVGIGVEVVLPTFVRIVEKNVRVLIGQGNYDWACPPYGVDYVASRVSPTHKHDVTVTRYESGHSVPEAQFAADAAAFVSKVLKEPKPPTPKASLD